MSRTIKQIIYGFFYLALLALLVYGASFVIKETAPTCADNRQNQGEAEVDCGGPNCEPCAIKHLLPITPKLEYFGVGGNTTVILNFSNPNLEYGAESFIYTINFYGTNHNKIFSLTKDSFIYPAEAQKTIVEPNLAFNYRSMVGQPEIVISSVNWKSGADFSEPKFQTRQIRTEVAGARITVSGILVNREAVSFPKATVGLLIYQQLTDNNKLVGASKTVLQNIKPFEERAFKIIVPLDVALKLPELDSLITVEVQR